MRLRTITPSPPDLFLGCLSLYAGVPIIVEAPDLVRSMAAKTVTSRRFTDWLKSLNISGSLGKPIEGSVGLAYPIGDYIIKFTSDQKEAHAAAVLKNHDSAHAASVYDVRRVASFDNPNMVSGRGNLFAIAMEKLNTGVSKKMRIAGGAVYDYLDNNPGFIEDPDSMVTLVVNRFLSKQHRNDKDILAAVKKIIMALYDVQQKTGVLSQDTHGANLAFKGREPAFFDFGRSSVDYQHPKSDNARITGLN